MSTRVQMPAAAWKVQISSKKVQNSVLDGQIRPESTKPLNTQVVLQRTSKRSQVNFNVGLFDELWKSVTQKK